MFNRGPRGERGVAAVIVGITMSLVLLVSAAFAVDLGMQRVVRRDMQAVADVAALDLSRLLEGKTVAQYSGAAFDDALVDSLTRNEDAIGEDLGIVGCDQLDGQGDNDVDAGACWEFVVRNAADTAWVPTTMGTQRPEAVRVWAKSTVGFAFGGVTDVGDGSATRTAVAQMPDKTLCFEMGSFAAALALGDSVLGPMADWLGLTTELGLVTYQNLAGGDVSLGDIAAAPSIGSPEALMDPSGVRVGDLIEATIYALQHEEDEGATGTAAAISALQLLQTGAGLDLDATVVVPDVVSVDAGDTSSLGAQFNVLELIGAALAIANGDNFVATQVPVDLTPLGLGSANLEISAIQGPRADCGTPYANTADDCKTIDQAGGACVTQSQVSFSLSFAETTIPLVQAGSTSINATVGPITLTGGVGNAKGVLTSIDKCDNQLPDNLTVDVSSGLLGVGLNVPLHIDGSVRLAYGDVLPDALANLVDAVLSLPGLLTGLLGGTQYEYRNFALTVSIDEVGANLNADSEGSTSNTQAHLESPTNDRTTGVPVRVPDPPQAPELDDLAVPGSLLNGRVDVKLTFEVRSRTTGLLGLPTSAWTAWTPGEGALLTDVDLSDLTSLPGVAGAAGTTIQAVLDQLVSLLNSQVVDTVNDTFSGTLLPLLGLSGTGADLFSVRRTKDCGGVPKLVG